MAIKFLSDISQIIERNALPVSDVTRQGVLSTCVAYRSEICEIINKIDVDKRKRIRVICEICGSLVYVLQGTKTFNKSSFGRVPLRNL